MRKKYGYKAYFEGDNQGLRKPNASGLYLHEVLEGEVQADSPEEARMKANEECRAKNGKIPKRLTLIPPTD